MTVAALAVKSLHADRDCKAYLIWDPVSREAAVIDPRFDFVPRYLREINDAGLSLRYAVDTHTHADHLSGSDRLRNITGCKVVMSAATKSRIPDVRVEDGQALALGDCDLTFLHTPGHTPDSMCIFDGARVFTGDTLFIGGSARTDFMGGSSEQLFDSFRKLEALGDEVEVWPGHDYHGREHSTIGEQKTGNPAFADSKENLIARLAAKAALPANMAEILSFNTQAGIPEDRILMPQDLSKLGAPGEDYTLLDVRYADEFAAGRAPGAVHIPMPEVAERMDEIKKLPHPIISICRSGVRATYMMMTARHAGDEDWMLLEGGMLAWRKSGLALESDGAEPDVVASKMAGPGGSCMAAGGCAAG